ncbi:tetratricopeptide repeat protein [Limnohabitans sp. Rim11]|jgi:predicted negative regulator of RcsB-dependent stress response|uniref:YfgM family protein n=1 Tax=Limnohabitans sp. Rim11 TaxID=1100719 RepID=UPI000A50782C|nr:tetratricopeptide repeat protein [Limnohabitans sp. Rim11]
MASNLDLEQQEQLDELKHFWKQYGNAITWFLIVVMGAYAGWNGYQYWQKQQSTKAAALFDEVERAAASGDTAKLERSWNDMKDRFPGTTYAAQSALLAGKTFQQTDKPDAALAALKWAAESASDDANTQLARLRLANLQIQQKAFDDAAKTLTKPFTPAFAGLALDIQGDLFMAQSKSQEAVKAYTEAWSKLEINNEYRRLVLAKLNALGADPENAKGASK